jgi:hypothetical protein
MKKERAETVSTSQEANRLRGKRMEQTHDNAITFGPQGIPGDRLKLIIELTPLPFRPIRNADAYAPALRVSFCAVCGSEILQVGFDRERNAWAETTNPVAAWIRIGFPFEEFCSLTRLCRIHPCFLSRIRRLLSRLSGACR